MPQSPAPPTGATELLDAILDVAKQIADVVKALPSPDVAIPRSTWTVGEAAAHLLTANRHMAMTAADEKPAKYGDGTPTSLAAANAGVLQRFTERDPAALARGIAGQAGLFVKACQVRPAVDIVDTPLGTMPLSTLGSYLLAHMLSHGTAITDAVAKPTIVRPQYVELALPFLIAMLPRLAKPEKIEGVNLRFEVRLRGGSRFTALIANNTVTVDDPAGRATDCVISADPVAFFLLAMGNRRQWPFVVTGKLGCWGRQPWLGVRFVSFFDTP